MVPTPHLEGAVYTLNLLSATGTGILLAAVVGALVMKYKPLDILRTWMRTLWLVRYSLLTIVLMLGLGTLTRFSGTDTRAATSPALSAAACAPRIQMHPPDAPA